MNRTLSICISALMAGLSTSAFSQTTALPQGVEWLSNNNEPLFASQDAIRGGTLRTFMASFPQTLRSVGPDANSGLRHYFMDGAPKLAQRHPNT
ncbi:ABC transporter substrate-binding protein, partial [Vibrio fortis]